jgi:hypothetical protein
MNVSSKHFSIRYILFVYVTFYFLSVTPGVKCFIVADILWEILHKIREKNWRNATDWSSPQRKQFRK